MSDLAQATLIQLLLAPVQSLSLLIFQHSTMARSPSQSDPSLCFSPPLPITLMRIRCHSSSCGCLLFNWRLIFWGCHFNRVNKGLPFIVAPVKERGRVGVTQSDGSVMCFGLQTLLSRLSVSLALHLFSLFGWLRFHLAPPVHQLNAVLLNLSVVSQLVFLDVRRYKWKFPPPKVVNHCQHSQHIRSKVNEDA